MKQRNKQKGVRRPLVWACGILALIAAVLFALLFRSGSNEAGSSANSVLEERTGQTQDALAPAANGTQPSGEGTYEDAGGNGGTDGSGAGGAGSADSKDKEDTGADSGGADGEDDEDGGADGPAQSAPEALGDTGTQAVRTGDETASQTETVTLPYEIPGSNLVVRQVSSYSGAFLEDGSDQDVSNVTVMILENAGRKPVEYAGITMTRSDGAVLEFEATDIPAGAVAVVQEKNKAAYLQASFDSCTASVAEVDTLELSDDVSVEETEDGSLLVTNLTGQDIACVRIFYKFYMEDEDAYVGGITYVAKLSELAAGDFQTVTPSHYQSGYSKVVMVRTYATAE